MQPIDRYIKEKRLELSTSVLSRKIIYLDTNYWVKIRDQSTKIYPQDRVLLNIMTSLVESKKCIFPISEISFYEILKQGDLQKRKDIAKVVDKLSEGISIINAQERIQLEFSHFIRSTTNKAVYNLNELIWSKLAFILVGPTQLQTDSFVLQKAFFDFINDISLAQVIEILQKNGGGKAFIYKDDIETQNRDKKKYEGENKSFREMFLSELGGLLDLHKESLNEAMYNLYYMDTGRFPTEEEKTNKNENLNKNLVYNAFRLGKITTELPICRIPAELFAAVRWNKERKYKDGNDTMDFLHASFALPYCDFFFTERELRGIIIQRKLDTLYNCRIESDPNKVLQILSSLE